MHPPRPPAADVVLSGLGVATTLIVAGLVKDYGLTWDLAAYVAIHLGLSLALALRRVRRRSSFVATYALLAALAAVVQFGPHQLGVSPIIVAAPLALYVVARHEATPWGVVGLLLGIGGAFVSPVTQMPGGSGALVPVAILVMVGTYLWASGRRRTELGYLERSARDRDEHTRELARGVAQARSDERVRLARELHDIVAHSLAVVNVQAGTGLAVGTPEHMRASLSGVREASAGALAELRAVVGVLREGEDPRLDVAGDLSRVPQLADEAAAAGVRLETDLPDTSVLQGWQATWPAQARLAVVRVTQEALSNAIKHGGPRPRARLSLTTDDAACTVLVTNDAVAPGPSCGFGLTGLEERVALCGGEFVAGPTGDGFAVRARIPLRRSGGPGATEGR